MGAAKASLAKLWEGYDDRLVVPPRKTYEAVVALPPGLETELEAFFDEFNRRARKEAAKIWDPADPRYRDVESQVTPEHARALAKGLAEPTRVMRGELVVNLPDLMWGNLLARDLTELLERISLPLVARLRLGFLLGIAVTSERDFYFLPCHERFLDWIRSYFAREDSRLTLTDLASASDAAGIGTGWIEILYLDWLPYAEPNPFELEPDAIWPFFLEHTEGLEAGVGLKASSRFVATYNGSEFKQRAYSILRMFPRPPRSFVGYLWERALGTGKVERPLARACLDGYPERHEPIIQALSDGRKDVRTVAAEWLGRLQEDAAVGPIRKALRKEKHDAPKAAMMGALEALGVDVDQFLNRKRLLAEAEKGLKKPIHKNLQWFAFDRLPAVHWAKNRQVVPPEIVRWFVVQAFRAKSPEPNPLLRRYCQLMRDDERRRLGSFVLDVWLQQDTLPRYNPSQAADLADQDVAQTKRWAAQNPEHFPNFNEATYRQRMLDYYLRECRGSAISSKGILALAGACCGPEVVAPVERYLKQWYGQRVHQCKALIRMLSWVDHPLAIQLVLAVAARFRTRTIQQEAARCVELIAERKGWSRDELADRTIPTAGFESDGTQVIDYGTRTFTARLGEDLVVQLFNAAGKQIKSLPAANTSEDVAEVKAVKKRFSAHRKELEQVLKLQRERLYEAMCTERRWRFEDWNLFLHRHPIVGRYCQRLVWLAERIDESTVAFRPLADQTLSDVADASVELNAEDRVRIAHASLLPSRDAVAWLEHLADYEIDPLFRQFGGDSYRLSEAAEKATEISDFEGHLIDTFRLRGRAGKLGYVRGPAEDGGWFYTYLKSFPSLELQAVIEFTGNLMPEENRPAALLRAFFIRQHGDQHNRSSARQRPLELESVPEILVSETYNDLRAFAADGSGFDPEWEKTTNLGR